MKRYLKILAVTLAILGGSDSARAATKKDYAGQTLDKPEFQDGNLNNANFEGTSAVSGNFRNATCKKANFHKAKLESANFDEANLEDADFSDADLTDARFRNAKAWHARFTGTTFRLTPKPIDISKVADFRAQQTLIANATHTAGDLSLHYADLRYCTLSGDAEGVDFRDADFRNADLKEVTELAKARLGRAKYNDKTVWPTAGNFDPTKFGMELVASEPDAPADKKPEAKTDTGAKTPLVKRWLILKGEEDAPDSGTLEIFANHTFEWTPALGDAKPQVLLGKWAEAGDDIEIPGGERGEKWTAKVVTTKSGKAEVHLQSENGLKRVGVPE